MHTQTEVRRLNDLKATNAYLRLGTDVSDLEKSISTVGLIAPLVIAPDNVILAGARRYQALLNLGYTEVPVVVVDKGELERELVSIDENLVRKDLSKIELEGHLRRAKEIYQAITPLEEQSLERAETEEELDEREEQKAAKKEVLPAEKFLHIVAEKTGLSPKQIHEAINRDEKASSVVREARKKGELSISQTNEIVKLNKDEQKRSIDHIKTLPVREIKKFVKVAKTEGVEEALKATPKLPHAREFNEVEQALKKLQKKLKQLELEGLSIEHFPESIQKLFGEIMSFGELAYMNYHSEEKKQQEMHQ